ncbi:hypothetical protein ACHAP8_010485 [Fusarium lateritium]
MSGQPQENTGRSAARGSQNLVAKRAAENWLQHDRIESDDINEFVGFLHKPPGEGWTEQDEDAIQRQWDESEMKQVKEHVKWHNYAEFMSLWKICLRVRRCSPVYLISPMSNLRFLPAAEARSFFIINADDALNDCPAFKRSLRWLQSARGSGLDRSTHSILEEAMDRSVEKGERVLTTTKLLHKVGSVAIGQQHDVPTPTQAIHEQYGFQVISITIEDLNNVRQAIDTFEWPESMREEFACTTGEALQSYRLMHKRHEKPAAAELGEYFERSHKDVMRDCRMETKDEADPDMNSEDEDIHSGVDAATGEIEDVHQTLSLQQSGGHVLSSPSSPNAATVQQGFPTAAVLQELVRRVPQMEAQIHSLTQTVQRQDTVIQDQSGALQDYATEVRHLRRELQQLREDN